VCGGARGGGSKCFQICTRGRERREEKRICTLGLYLAARAVNKSFSSAEVSTQQVLLDKQPADQTQVKKDNGEDEDSDQEPPRRRRHCRREESKSTRTVIAMRASEIGRDEIRRGVTGEVPSEA
jgi:hypothetical protein